jgi:hypothetical protein
MRIDRLPARVQAQLARLAARPGIHIFSRL